MGVGSDVIRCAKECPMVKVSPANEDYLEAVYELCGENGAVRSVDVAAKLNVSKASVNKAIGMLKTAGLVKQEYYGDVMLTPEGRAYGESVLERHHMLRKFLVNVLGVESDVAEEEACRMEHAISDSTMRKWVTYLKEQGI